MRSICLTVLVALATLAALSADGVAQLIGSDQGSSPSGIDSKPIHATGLGRGVNFGNMLEAPAEGAWGLTVQEAFFDRVVEAGMDHVRLPVSWTHHADQSPPYTIHPVFLDRVEWCVDQATSRGLSIIVNTHHYDELNGNPVAETPRALAIWSQVAQRFADRPVTRTPGGAGAVLFEVLNEPHGEFNVNASLWDTYLAQALGVIRESNPDRWVLAGPIRWNSIDFLHTFNPPADPRLALTVHFYQPFAFTHQGASWMNPPPPVGTAWTGEPFEFASPWSNWSWNTDAAPANDGLEVSYLQGFGGLYFRRDEPLGGIRRIVFEADRALTLNVIIGNDDGTEGFRVVTSDDLAEYTVEVPKSVGPSDRVMLQNATNGPAGPFVLSSMRVETGGHGGFGSETMIASEEQAIARAVERASAWALERGLSVHLGEFGAYREADMDSRSRWTRAVRTNAERAGMAWSYWELAAGFGFYDPQAGVFREPLLEALVD